MSNIIHKVDVLDVLWRLPDPPPTGGGGFIDKKLENANISYKYVHESKICLKYY
jgi:hypothetical protein